MQDFQGIITLDGLHFVGNPVECLSQATGLRPDDMPPGIDWKRYAVVNLSLIMVSLQAGTAEINFNTHEISQKQISALMKLFKENEITKFAITAHSVDTANIIVTPHIQEVASLLIKSHKEELTLYNPGKLPMFCEKSEPETPELRNIWNTFSKNGGLSGKQIQSLMNNPFFGDHMSIIVDNTIRYSGKSLGYYFSDPIYSVNRSGTIIDKGRSDPAGIAYQKGCAHMLKGANESMSIKAHNVLFRTPDGKSYVSYEHIMIPIKTSSGTLTISLPRPVVGAALHFDSRTEG